jgi:hypothetical protein
MYTSWIFWPQSLFYFLYQYGQMLYNRKSSKVSSLSFYLSMPPLECHHPRILKAVYLLSKQKYLQHLLKTIRETKHTISYSLHIPWGEIMKVGYTFACFMRKKTVFSQVIQLPTYKSIFFI